LYLYVLFLNYFSEVPRESEYRIMQATCLQVSPFIVTAPLHHITEF